MSALAAALVMAGCAGEDGKNGAAGAPGADGTSCTVTLNLDGSKTISCDDGTTATVTDGTDGSDCTVVDNLDGTKTISCTDGTTSTVADGASCTVTTDATTGVKTVTCEDGTTATLTAVADLVKNVKPESCGVCHAGSGDYHQAEYNKYTDASTLTATIDDVAVTDTSGTGVGPWSVAVTFSIDKGGIPYVADIAQFAQKTVYVTKYDPATRQFAPSNSLSTRVSNGDGTYVISGTGLTFDPTASDAMIYAYFVEVGAPTIVAPKGNYKLYEDVASVAVSYGTLDYVSSVNVASCSRCHGTPYQKHGYRAGAVAGIPDMAACKACHYDTRNGGHQAWQLLAEDPAAYAAQAGTTTADQNIIYAYKATTMNDTHMSHAMEFAYPQTMANCVTCHEGKLASILTTANFKVQTCKSCHPVTNADAAYVDAKRAPSLQSIMTGTTNLDAMHGTFFPAGAPSTLYEPTTAVCNGCHTGFGPTFATIHTGYNAQIYADTAGAKFSDAITTAIDSASFDAATKLLTVSFSVTGANASALIKPTVVMSLYGYGTKDFIVSGHGSQPAPDGKRNLEWVEASTSNSPRLTVSPAVATQGNATWTATADLTLWASRLTDGSVKRMEIGVLPVIGLDQTLAVSTTSVPPNPAIAAKGITRTFDLVGNALVADASSYGKAIVDTGKCNACHEALGTTFHSPSYGSAGVVACRLCHVVGSGGSHLEMQSRSIDSYVHAIHSMTPFDIGDVNFADPVAALRYDHHRESTYPNFTLLNCESCHNAGTYNVPDQSRSMASLLSKSDTVATWDRNIGAIPAYVTGPGSRACGSCHRAEMINEDLAGDLAAFNGHTEAFGYMVDATTYSTTILEATIAKIMAMF